MSANPFRGLETYEEKDQETLFGRDRDSSLLEGRILSAPTTVLFAGSGVGKTSFLKARFIPDLRRTCRICFYAKWAVKKPDEELRAAIEGEFKGDGNRGLLILDQFEEVFQYHRDTEEFAALAVMLAGVLSTPQPELRLLVAIREEFLGDLSAFDSIIPDVFNNYYRLRNPEPAGAKTIIRGIAETAGASCDDKGLAALVSDLQTIARPRPGSAVPAYGTVPLPYMQIACHGLWNETPPPPDQPFLRGYNTGDARKQLDRYCIEKLDRLKPDEKEAASDAFGYLITRGGAKRAYALPELADLLDKSDGEVLRSALSTLAKDNVRILRTFNDPSLTPWFELYHDMYGQFLSDWKAGIEAERKRRDRELQELLAAEVKKREAQEREVERQRKREKTARKTVSIALIVFGCGLLALVGWSAALVWQNLRTLQAAARGEARFDEAERAFTSIHESWFSLVSAYPRTLWAEYWDYRAQQELFRNDVEAALLLRLKALSVSPDLMRRRRAADIVENGYRHLLATVNVPAEAGTVALTDQGRTVVVCSSSMVSFFDAETGKKRSSVAISLKDGSVPEKPAGAASPQPGLWIHEVSPDGKFALASPPGASPGFWQSPTGPPSRTVSEIVREKVTLVDLASGKAVGQTLDVETLRDRRLEVYFSEGGALMTIWSGVWVYCFELRSDGPHLIRRLPGSDYQLVSASDRLIAAITTSGRVRVVDVRTGDARESAVLPEHAVDSSRKGKAVTPVQVLPPVPSVVIRKGFVMVSAATGVLVLSSDTLAEIRRLPIHGRLAGASSDGSALYVDWYGSLSAYDAIDGKPIGGPLLLEGKGQYSIQANRVLDRSPAGLRVWSLPESSDAVASAQEPALLYSADLTVGLWNSDKSQHIRRVQDGTTLLSRPLPTGVVAQSWPGIAQDGSSAWFPVPSRDGEISYVLVRVSDKRERTGALGYALRGGAGVFYDRASPTCTLWIPDQPDLVIDNCKGVASNLSGDRLYVETGSTYQIRAADSKWAVVASGPVQYPAFQNTSGGYPVLDSAGKRVTDGNRVLVSFANPVWQAFLPLHQVPNQIAFGPGPDRITTCGTPDGLGSYAIHTGRTGAAETRKVASYPGACPAYPIKDESAVFMLGWRWIHRLSPGLGDNLQLTTRMARGNVRQISLHSTAATARTVVDVGGRERIVEIPFDFSDVVPLPDRNDEGWSSLLDEWQQRLGREIGREGEVYVKPPTKLD